MKKMERVFTTLLAAALFGTVVSAHAADDKALADRHAGYGAACQSCHKDAAPKAGAKVANEACFVCHQNYDALAKRTAKLDPNPHYTHLGNVRCSDCHSGHASSKLMCNDCHNFSLTVK